MNFTDEQQKRYLRHIILKGFGADGQKKLLASRVLIVGAGGLGSPAGLYLAASGVKWLGIIDNDSVELVNLQRQIVHRTGDVGNKKVDSFKRSINELNPDVEVVTYHETFSTHNARELVKQYDFIIDGADNFATKFLINDACILENKPYSYGGVLQFSGQTMTVLPRRSTCFRCVFTEAPAEEDVTRCCQAGILGVLPGVIGCIQATEAIKQIEGIGDLLTGRLLTYNALTMEFRSVPFKRNHGCAVCGENPAIKEINEANYAHKTTDRCCGGKT